MKKIFNFIKNYMVYILISFVVLVLPLLLFVLWNIFFDVLKKEIIVELGTEELTEELFFKEGKIPKNTTFITDIHSLDLSKVVDYEVEIKIDDKTKVSIVHIKDTTPPKLEVKEVYAYTDYEPKVEDFVVLQSDFSNVTLEIKEPIEINELKDYPVTIVAKDEWNNITEKETILHIGVVKTELKLELGSTLKKEDFLYKPEETIQLDEEKLGEINKSGVGEYFITVIYEEKEYSCKVIVSDTLPPEVTLKDVSIYDDEENVTKEKFIESVKDASEVTTELVGEITYHQIGTQELTIVATDAYGNKTEKKAKLNIVKDTTPPVIYGLSNMTVNKYTQINFLAGVRAVDEKDGTVNVSVNSGNVNVNKAGTYYATYSAKDKSGNTKTASRKIVVNHDQSDTMALVNEHASKVGNSIAEINQYVKTKIGYSNSWGDNDPVWYGLTNFRGNCYVHAMVYQKILEKKGYQVQLIWTTDQSHYWNLVYTNGKWCHSDSTPGNKQEGIICANDADRIAMLQGRDWDHSKWPKAE